MSRFRIQTHKRHHGKPLSPDGARSLARPAHGGRGPLLPDLLSHVASRTSPDRTAVSTRNSNASPTAGCAEPARTVSMGRGHILVGKRPPVGHDVVLRAEHRQHPITRVVVSHVQGEAPLQHRADTLANLPGRRRHDVPDRRQDLQNVGRVDVGDGPVADAEEDVPFHAPPPVLGVPLPAPGRSGSRNQLVDPFDTPRRVEPAVVQLDQASGFRGLPTPSCCNLLIYNTLRDSHRLVPFVPSLIRNRISEDCGHLRQTNTERGNVVRLGLVRLRCA